MEYQKMKLNEIRLNNDVASGMFYLEFKDNYLKIVDESNSIVWMKTFECQICTVKQAIGNFNTACEQIQVDLESGKTIIYSTLGNLLYESAAQKPYFDNYAEEFRAPIIYTADLYQGFYQVDVQIEHELDSYEIFDTRGMCVYLGDDVNITFNTYVGKYEVFNLKSRDDLTISSIDLKRIESKPITYIIGDSTLANKVLPYWSWPQLLQAKTGNICINYAIDARSTKSFMLEQRFDKLLETIKPGDTVVIGFGHNDQKPNKFGVSETEFIQNLKYMIKEISSRHASSVIVTPIARRLFVDGTLINSHNNYLNTIQNNFEVVANLNQFTTQVIKQLGEEESKKLFVHSDLMKIYDNTHTSFLGANLICDFFIKASKHNKNQ
ncbi:GDSL-type esterase/lipase family protein [Mollicutes bacterium LVI A0039]|nr:GDSL-type esterase/lipase family protein [Mollicutes bacterium LVI A0039]